MRLSLDKISGLCCERGINTARMLKEAGVSRNAFYHLARKDTVVPRSVVQIAEYLGVPISGLLEEAPTRSERIRDILSETERIHRKYRDTDPDNVRHTLLLLEDEPVERLRRAIRRGRSFNFRRKGI
ncbi:MAG: hypothetical protein R6U43_07025 [Candidatus Krumholzibacteriales bacterium]